MIRIPLLKDHHNHLFTYSNLNKAESLFYVKDKKSALRIFEDFSNSKINVATGWFDSYYGFADDELDCYAPLIICNNSLHKYLFNNKASEIIEKVFPDWIKNNTDQLWVEKNIMQILSYISGIFGFDDNSLQDILKKNLNSGVCFASDMFVTSESVFNFLDKTEFRSFTEIWTDPELYSVMTLNQQKLCSGVKLFTDGALGASTAAISEYKIKGNSFLTYTDFELNAKLENVLSMKCDIAIHCIGDIAIEQVIKTLELQLKQNSSKIVRLEHAQFITENQAKRAKDLGLILSMQPNFNMDSVVYIDRMTQKYCEANNPFRMLIDNVGFIPGKDLIFGSDGMPTGIDGTLQESLFPPVPGQKVSLEEFAAAYCTDNLNKGFINVHIDQLKRKVVTEVNI
jgi:predicted amidohydrolase YtcJ